MLKSKFIEEQQDKIGEIPVIRLIPKYTEKPYRSLILYHGWSSSKEVQLMRGMILATFGYQVIIPDSINHGERGKVDYNHKESFIKYFWPTVRQNLDEYEEIRDYMIENFDADAKKMGVIGNSMGGISASGIFTYNSELEALVVLNGSGSWDGLNRIFKGLLPGEYPEWLKEEERKVSYLDPINNLPRLIDRPILLLHGAADTVVDIRSQKEFYETAYPKYTDRSKINLIEYDNLNHIVSTNMLEEAVKWFDKFIL